MEKHRRRKETKKCFEGIREYKQQVTLPIICKDAECCVISQTYFILKDAKVLSVRFIIYQKL